jgi:hypothetical protein
MVDDLAIPSIPEAKPEDPEDVSWALSTAEAMWARGDHSEGIKWVRKAAEAASEAEDDERALELAKAAADLAGLVTRRSRVAHDEAPPQGTRSAPPPAARSVPPASSAPSPSRVSQSPPKPAGRPLTRPPPAMPSGKPSAMPKPAVRNEKRGRRSRENLADAARAAGLLAPTREVPLPNVETTESPAADGRRAKSSPDARRNKRRSRHDDTPEPPRAERSGATEDWDASPTASMSREELDSMDIEPIVASPAPIPPPAPPPAPRAPMSTLHDPELQTCQAIRVVIWQDASGVHIAPAGTVVSAITVEGMVVALDPNTDLTAWLSRRDR